jgi:hypothetical protein
MTEEVTALYRSSVNGEAFAAALSERGYRLVKGDRRDYCLIDAAGHVHSMARRLHFVKAGELESFMAGIDRNGLPSVAEARKEAIKRLANSSQG